MFKKKSVFNVCFIVLGSKMGERMMTKVLLFFSQSMPLKVNVDLVEDSIWCNEEKWSKLIKHTCIMSLTSFVLD